MIFIYMYTIINDNPFENLKKRKCVKNCGFNEMLQKICIIKYVTNETKTNGKKRKRRRNKSSRYDIRKDLFQIIMRHQIEKKEKMK